MKKDVDAIFTSQKRDVATSLLLRHCVTLGWAENRVPARLRLERTIGPELTRRLIASLTAHSRR